MGRLLLVIAEEMISAIKDCPDLNRLMSKEA